MVDPIGKRCSNRVFEWMSAAGMMCYGAHILSAPSALLNSRYAAVIVLFGWPILFGLCCFVTGSVRLMALYRNGTWPVWGPRLRIVLAVVAAFLWLQLAVALLQWSKLPPSPGMWIYFALTGAEIRTVWRAARDANAIRAR